MARALVTGATGFVGSHLAALLVRRGYSLRCTVRPTSDRRWLEGVPFEAVEGDLRDGPGLDEAMTGVDRVFHVAGTLAGRTIGAFRDGNVRSTARLLDAAVRARVPRFLYVSSLAAAGPSPDGTPIDESAPCRPVSMYGQSKAEAEREVLDRRGRIEVTVVRPPVVFGPRDRGLLDLFKILSRGIQPVIGGRKTLSSVYVADLAEGIVAASENPRAIGQTFFLSSSRILAMEDFTTLILGEMGRAGWRVRIPDAGVLLLGRVADGLLPLLGRGGLFGSDKAREMTQSHWVCTAGRAKNLLGWEAGWAVEEAVRETVGWYRLHRWI